MNSSLYAARRRRNSIMLSLSLAATLLGLGWLVVILFVLAVSCLTTIVVAWQSTIRGLPRLGAGLELGAARTTTSRLDMWGRCGTTVRSTLRSNVLTACR